MLKVKLLFIAWLASLGCFAQGWTQKSNFSGGMKSYAFSFVVGSKAYIGAGLNSGQVSNDFWEYDPGSDTWTQRATFIGQARYNAASFSIGTKGYVGTGANAYQIGTANFYEYDPATNTWRTRASLANGNQRTGAVGFAIGSKGYIGLGRHNTYFKNDFWEYDPATNRWRQRASYPGMACSDATAFAIGTKAYVGLGYNISTAFRTFYEYNPASNTWATKASLPSLIRSGASAFAINNKGYVVLGSSYTKDVWEYDAALNQWKRKMNFTGPERKSAAAFTVNGKGYIVGGMRRTIYYDDVWEYNVDSCTISALARTHVKPNLCVYDSITMSANSDSGLVYQWRLDGVDIPGANTRYYYAKTPGFYSVYISGNNICSNTSSSINVIKPCNETPAIVDAGANKRICLEDSAILKGSISGSANKAKWSGGNGVFLPNTDSLIVTYVPTAGEYANGKIKLFLTTDDPDSTGPLTAAIDSVNIYISSGPPEPSSINGPWYFCANTNNYVFTVAAETGVNYSWIVPDEATINSGQGTGKINIGFNANAVDDTVFVSSTNACGTSPEKYLLVTLVTGLPAPTPPINGLNSGCPGNSSRYSITRTAGAISYTWTPPKGATINGSTGPITLQDTAVTVVYTKYFMGDTLKVKAINCFGYTTEEIMPVARKYVDPPAEIIGSTIGCMNDSNVYKISKVPYAEYYIWTLPIGATINGKALSFYTPDTVVTINFTGAFASDSIKVKAYGCAGFSVNRSLLINRSSGTANCHGCTLNSSIDNVPGRCAGDTVKITARYTGASEICNACDLYATGVYNFTGNVTNAPASVSSPDGVAAWMRKGSSGIMTQIAWDMGEIIPAGSTVSVGVKTDGCTGSSVKSIMQFWAAKLSGAGIDSLISQSANISYYSSKYREFSFNTSVDCQYLALSDEGGCGIRVDYIKWKKSCCTSSAAVTYLWSTGETTANINVTPTSTTNYHVKITDRGNCTSTSNVTVNIVDKPVARINGMNVKCPGSAIQLCADTASSYLWSNGSTTQCINANTAGTYTLTVGNNLCTASDTKTITELVLSDNDACTTDACDPVNGVTHVAVNINDNNVCTTDGCNTTTGVYHNPVNTDDNNACTTDGCDASTGVYHNQVNINDNNACTTDACNTITGAVTHTAININDNNACTTDACNPVNGVSHIAINVNDNNVCTTDGCNTITGVYHNPVNTDDNNTCTNDGCNASTGVYHSAVNINDNNVCTTDACNATTGAITHIVINVDDNNACTTDACDPINGVTHVAVNVNDNNVCTTDGCNTTTGVYHNPVNTDDNNACTTDGCDASTGVYHNPMNTDDNNACTNDGCDASTGVYHSAVNINDNNVCTTDACNTTTGAITHIAINVDDNNACTTDACDPVNGVTHVAININDNNACTTDACDPVNGVSHLAINVNDNNACTTDGCNEITGVYHNPVNTDDNNACTTDGCDALTGVYHNQVNIDDYNACTTDACNTITGAITHITLNVNDNNACTTDACDPVNGVTHVAININDNNACTTDACDPVNGVTNAAVNVDDNNACTTDACNITTGAITHTIAITPVQPGPVSGNSLVCPGDNVVYKISKVASAEKYVWTPPTGATINGSALTLTTTDTAVTINFGSLYNSGNVLVKTLTCTQFSANQSLTVSKKTPVQPGAITGTINVCPGNNFIYSIRKVANVDLYIWTPPAGATINGSTAPFSTVDTSVRVLFGTLFTGDNLKVKTSACATNSIDQMLMIKKILPTQPGTISGPAYVCIGDSNIYSINKVPLVDSYTWTPAPGTLINGLSTPFTTTDTSVKVVFTNLFNGDSLKVYTNACSVKGTNRSLMIVKNTVTRPAAIYGITEVCPGDIKVYTINKVPGAQFYNWTLPANVTINGSNAAYTSADTAVKVTFAGAFNGGNLQVKSIMCNSTSTNITLSINKSTPVQPGNIYGKTSACMSDSVLYSVDRIANADFYLWTPPFGATINGSSTPVAVFDTVVKVVYASSFTGGNLSVQSSTCSALSNVRRIKIVVGGPDQPGVISGLSAGLCNTANVTYSIIPVANVVSYTWRTNINGVLINGSASSVTTTSTSVSATFKNFSSGLIYVKANNACGSGAESSLSLSAAPADPVSITGSTTVCAGQTNVIYATPLMPSATSYSWAMSAGSSILSGQNTSSVSTDIKNKAGAGWIKVRADNVCGSSAYFTLNFTIANCPRLEATENSKGEFKLNLYPNPMREKAVVKLQCDTEEEYTIKLYDNIGRIAYQNKFISVVGDNFINIIFSDLKPGNYVLIANSANNNGQLSVIKDE